jgi:hypothetical protein
MEEVNQVKIAAEREDALAREGNLTEAVIPMSWSIFWSSVLKL